MEDINKIALNTNQIKMMQHCIGYDHSRVKKWTFSAFRNYYAIDKNSDWDKLVEVGFAKAYPPTKEGNYWNYRLTTSGMTFLQEILGVRISLNEE